MDSWKRIFCCCSASLYLVFTIFSSTKFWLLTTSFSNRQKVPKTGNSVGGYSAWLLHPQAVNFAWQPLRAAWARCSMGCFWLPRVCRLPWASPCSEVSPCNDYHRQLFTNSSPPSSGVSPTVPWPGSGTQQSIPNLGNVLRQLQGCEPGTKQPVLGLTRQEPRCTEASPASLLYEHRIRLLGTVSLAIIES